MKKMMMFCAILMATRVFAASQKVDGITWQYYIEDGEAIVGVDILTYLDSNVDMSSVDSLSAIPVATKGNVTVPSGLGGCPVTTIGTAAFWCCKQITSVVIPEGIVRLGYGFGEDGVGGDVFYDCSALTSVSLPNSLKYMGSLTFCKCPKLTSISIPAGVESVFSPLALNCPKLASIAVAPGNMHYRAVDGVLYDYDVKELICVPGSRTSLHIPSSVDNIGLGTLMYASSLKEVVVDDANRVYSSKKGLLFDKSGKTLQECPGGLTRLVIPEGTTSMENGVCAGALTYVSIPASMVEIPDVDDDMVFGGSNLSQIDVAADNPKYTSTGDMLFDKAKTTLIWSAPTSKALTIPASVVTIQQSAFVFSKNYKLQSLTFQGPPPNLPFLEHSDYTRVGGYFAHLAYYSGSLKGCYTAYKAEWEKVIVNGKWQGLPMRYDPNAGSGTGGQDDSVVEGGFETAHTFNGLVTDEFGMCGMIQVATAKKSAKGDVKVSGFIMLEDGKKQTLKAVTAKVSGGALAVTTKVGKGDLMLTITDDGFTGTLGDMTVASGEVGEETGILSGTLKMSYFDAKTGKIKTKSITIKGLTTGESADVSATVKGQDEKFFRAEIVE